MKEHDSELVQSNGLALKQGEEIALNVKQHNYITYVMVRVVILKFKLQAPVVRKADSAIHRINHYPADSVVCFINTYPLDSDLSGG